MDREGAETYLRLLAEAAMRRSLAPATELRAPGASRLLVVGHALTVVGALDPVAAEEILTDFRLAETVRWLHREPGVQGISAAEWLGQGRCDELLTDTEKWPGEGVADQEGADTTPLYMSAAYACLGRWNDAVAAFGQINGTDFGGDDCARRAVFEWLSALIAKRRQDPTYAVCGREVRCSGHTCAAPLRRGERRVSACRPDRRARRRARRGRS